MTSSVFLRLNTLVLAFLLFATTSVSAQALKTYTGPYSGASVPGKATYQYLEGADGERIYQGPFKFTATDGSLIVAGQFKNNKREGAWLWTFKNFKPTNYYKNFPELTLQALTGSINGTYVAGNRNGVWQIKESSKPAVKVQGGTAPSPETLTATITYKNNMPAGLFSFTRSTILGAATAKLPAPKNVIETTGSFDDNGYLNGDVNIKRIEKGGVPVIEKRKYRSGVAGSLFSQDVSTGKGTKVDSTESVNHFFQNYDAKTGVLIESAGYQYLGKGAGSDIILPEGEEVTNDIDYGLNPLPKRMYVQKIYSGIVNGNSNAQVYNNLATDAIQAQDYQNAVTYSGKAVELDTTFAGARLNQSLALLLQGNPSSATAYANAVAAIGSNRAAKQAYQAAVAALERSKDKIGNKQNAQAAIDLLNQQIQKISGVESEEQRKAEEARIKQEAEARRVEEEKQKAEEAKRQEQLAKENAEKQAKLEEQRKLDEYNNSDYGKLTNGIKTAYSAWLQRTQFETPADYQKRMKKAPSQFNKIVTEQVNNSWNAAKARDGKRYAILNNYNIERQEYSILTTGKDGVVTPDTVKVKMPKETASVLAALYPKKTVAAPYSDYMLFLPSDFIIVNNKWVPSKGILLVNNKKGYESCLEALPGLDVKTNLDVRLLFTDGEYNLDCGNTVDPAVSKRATLHDLTKSFGDKKLDKHMFFYEWHRADLTGMPLDFTPEGLGIKNP